MKKNLLPILLVFFTINSFAQRGMDVGIGVGVTNYYGDLSNEKYFPAASTRPGVDITFRNFLNNQTNSGIAYRPLSIEARLSWHRIGYDETQPINGIKGTQLPNYGRGLSFRNDLYGVASDVCYTIYSSKYKPLDKQSAAFFMFAGAGVYYGVPMADLFRGGIDIKNRYYFWDDGTVRDAAQTTGKGNIIKKDGVFETNLNQWKTEGQGHNSELGQKAPYKFCHVGIPMGAGFRWGLSKITTLSLEFGYYKFMTDYLDDVSTRYATKDEIAANFPGDPVKQALASYISDPTGKGTTNGAGTSKRGNAQSTDSYSFINLEISYRFEFRHKVKL